MESSRMEERKERLNKFNLAWEAWEKRKLIEVNNLPFDKDCVDLIITKSNTNCINEPLFAAIFNTQESINIGCYVIPNQFDETNTQQQFTSEMENGRSQFDVLLLMSANSTFSDFGFKEIDANDENNSISHYRNSCLDFESFKDVFKPQSSIIMRTAIASGTNRAMEAVGSAFAFGDFLSNKNIEIKNTIVCVSSGIPKSTNDELNEIVKYSHSHIKRGMSLILNTFEDLSLGKDIRVSAFIGCFESNG